LTFLGGLPGPGVVDPKKKKTNNGGGRQKFVFSLERTEGQNAHLPSVCSGDFSRGPTGKADQRKEGEKKKKKKRFTGKLNAQTNRAAKSL